MNEKPICSHPSCRRALKSDPSAIKGTPYCSRECWLDVLLKRYEQAKVAGNETKMQALRKIGSSVRGG